MKSGGMKVGVVFDDRAVGASLDALVARAHAATRPAAQAGAQVFYEEVRQRAPVSAKGHWFHGTSYRTSGQKYWFEPGSLRAAIYQKYSTDNSTPVRATYHVAWNHKEAPYGFMVEFGTARGAAPHPFLRPAYDAAGIQAGQAMLRRFSAELRAPTNLQRGAT